ncbi:MAG TPA: HEAT repeat domain-containing protein, partial [Kofleriaceae bacterium]|nr:HEAT repeat domain-containing protein [Kofleriaceae bacterium]
MVPRWYVFVSLFGLAACASRAQQAVALYDKGDYAGAARAADTGLAAHPGDGDLWQMRVRAALAQGDAAGVSRAYATYRERHGGDDDRDLLRELARATLGQALASPSARLKIAAIRAVAAAEMESLAEAVVMRMGDDDDRVAAAAAIAVIHADPRAPDLAEQMMHSESAEARRIAVDGVGQKVGKIAISDLEAAANDGDPRVRRTAIFWLGQSKARDAAATLTAHLRDPDEAVRAAAGTALAAIAADRLPELAEAAIGDPA